MAASTCFPSTLSCWVPSFQLASHVGRSTYSPLHLGPTIPSFVPLSSPPLRSSVVAFWRPKKKKESNLVTTTQPIETKKKSALDDFMDEEEQEYIEEEEEEENDGVEVYSEEDALNAFFSQLEKDINDHNPSEENIEIKDEDVAVFEKELAESLGEAGGELEEGVSDSEGFVEENAIQSPENKTWQKLKTWQMRKLARALKIGKRKASIKKLSEEVVLDRATVLELLRNPPPGLLLMSDSLRDEPRPLPPAEPKNNEIGSSISSDDMEVKSKGTELEVKQQAPQQPLPPQKRLKRAQVETLERVYSRTKRPTNEMISSIMQVTNLPRKIVVTWFEEKREHDGVPHQPMIHAPYQRRSVTRTVSR
ncbi:overexpressor of cationic peroxidase 3 [Rhynchospora pubera]|uniref:Overexpressor of cationic peroxidase 3 n=1 Tax=Rhynchospora pubera TaxID=906938 RepID=A0AAV8EM90_9POAL|nr:overexpressor of cationic peroxidase 3 [Rhynchospora pubera]